MKAKKVSKTVQDNRNKILYSTLFELGATGIGSCDAPNGVSELKLYSLNGFVIIVQDFGDDGFEVYAPIDTNNSFTSTIDALRSLAKR